MFVWGRGPKLGGGAPLNLLQRARGRIPRRRGPGPQTRGRGRIPRRLKRLLDLFDLERLDDVADLNLVEAFERDTAIEAFLHVASVVFEALEARHLALPERCALA